MEYGRDKPCSGMSCTVQVDDIERLPIHPSNQRWLIVNQLKLFAVSSALDQYTPQSDQYTPQFEDPSIRGPYP
jgi:hypothetical protein